MSVTKKHDTEDSSTWPALETQAGSMAKWENTHDLGLNNQDTVINWSSGWTAQIFPNRLEIHEIDIIKSLSQSSLKFLISTSNLTAAATTNLKNKREAAFNGTKSSLVFCLMINAQLNAETSAVRQWTMTLLSLSFSCFAIPLVLH